VPVLPVLAGPIVEELRVAQREAGKKRAAHQAAGLFEVRKALVAHLPHERGNTAPCQLAGRFDEA
jgi:hypothetical protein